MKVVYTDQSNDSLNEAIGFLKVDLGWSHEKVSELIFELLDKADNLEHTYNHYQEEEYLSHLGKGHRRCILGYFKIIYFVKDDRIFITDFFDTRQDPENMKG